MSDNEKIINKIKKCLALSASSNEHEAATALRQAQKLMEEYGVTESDVLAAEVNERKTKAGAKRKPAQWESNLAVITGKAFGCETLFNQRFDRADWSFIGCGVTPELAQHAFTVLIRQVKKARSEHIKNDLWRCKEATKTRRADLFCDAWVWGATKTIQDFSKTDQQTASVDAYMEKHYPAIHTGKAINRNADRKLNDADVVSLMRGERAGKEAELNRGMTGGDKPKVLGNAHA